jgi:transcriptional regulator with PAS, ATPase and Fis domain
MLSRRHLRLSINNAKVFIEDLGSANGTQLIRHRSGSAHGDTSLRKHDEPVPRGTPVPLEDVDVIRIGALMLMVESSSADLPLRELDSDVVLLAPVMKAAYEIATRAASSDISVLILGETGVGKEVLADTIHKRSRRADGPFLRINCAALSPTLLQSELFGYERGAFTGAKQAKAGLIEAANGGTLFQDEVGELPPAVQVNLLRVLETRSVLRVGATAPIAVDVRYITATHRDLSREIHAGNFRRDLFFRVSGLRIEVPPLRERPEEIQPLAELFLDKAARAARRKAPALSDEALTRLKEHHWPGNVRQLRNAMERAIILCDGASILPVHLTALDDLVEFGDDDSPQGAPPVSQLSSPQPTVGDNAEQERILEALEQHGGNQTQAARALGISRGTLINRLNTYGITRPRKRP